MSDTVTISPRQSSKRLPHCFRHRPVQAIMPTNRKRKEVVEPSTYKPQLSLLKDRDKLLLPRHRVPVLVDQRTRTAALPLPPKCHKEFPRRPESIPTCCSTSSLPTRKEEKTNGCSNSANNCPMALSKYFCPSVPFFFPRLFSSPSCPCSFSRTSLSLRRCYFWKCINKNEYDDKNKQFQCMNTMKPRCGTFYTNNSSRDWKKLSSISVFFFMVHFLLFAELIQFGTATPLPGIPTPTQTILLNMAYSEDTNNAEMRNIERFSKKRLSENQLEQDDDEYRHHHQLYTINNTTFDGGGTGVDEVKEMKNEKNGVDVNTGKGHSRGRNLYSDSIKYDSKNRSSNQVEFTSPTANYAPQETPNNSNNKNKLESVSRKEKEELTRMPLAMRMRTGAMILSSSSPFPASKQQQHDTLIQVTNDPPREMKESSSHNNGGDESSFVLINNNNNDHHNDNSEYMRVSTTTTTTTLGTCRPVSLGLVETEENETESLQSTVLSSVSDSLFISTPTTPPRDPIGIMCTGTNHLAITLSQIPEHFVHQVISIVVNDSLISTLNLSLFHRFSRLESVSVTHSNITQIIGTCPTGLKALNVSFNNIRKLNGSIFSTSGIQEGEFEYEDGGTDDDVTVETNNDDSESTSTNFSPEQTSSYFASSAEQQMLPKRQNKSNPELELLSLPPSSSFSSSPEPAVEKIPITSRLNYHSQKLIGAPFVRTRTKKLSVIPFLTNEQKQNELGEKDSSLFGISIDHQPHQQDDDLIQASKASHTVSATMEAVFLETAETNESSADDEDDEDDNDSDDDTVSRTYTDPETNKNDEEKVARRRVTPTSSGADFLARKEANMGCDINGSPCKSLRFVRKRRRVTGELDKHRVHDDGDNHEHKETRYDENINVDVLRREGYNYEEENAAREGHGDYYHYPRTSSSSSSGTASSSIVNKWENEIKTHSKPKATLFSPEKSSNMNRKRKARATTTTSSSSTSALSLEDIDLSYNKISELPRALLHLKSLKSLRLSGNQLKRDFVWEKLADWYMNSEDHNILKDGDDTFCGVVDDVRVFQFTVLGVLKAKKDLVETCRTVDKNICHECGLYSLNKQPGHGYNLSHQSPHGNVAIALKLDCSYRNLTELPAVPPQTWQLNVSGNSIKDLIPLKEPMYENLLILDADTNEINTLDGLTGTSFLDRYNYLSLQNNRFSLIPSNVLSSLKNMRGQGVTLLGANFIECDCDTVKDIKPLLLENSKKIKDLKEIQCKDMKTRSGESFMAVKDLQFTDLCYLDTEESNEMYLYLIIFFELLLIFVIVGKVWHDQRTFRRTGILPWCSAKMPRLPCDAMLESVKEPPHFNRSSSTNVRSYACEPPATQSISSCVQLREVRSNSGQSEKSSQISQLSSFPGSSRTSSV